MMGHTHALSGAAGWLAVTGSAPIALSLAPMSASAVVAGAVVTAGAALLPDADHHSGTIAHSLPPLSKVVTRSVGTVTGGHRHATHSLVGIAAATALATMLAPVPTTVTLPTIGNPGVDLQLGPVPIDLPHLPGGPLSLQVGAWLLVLLPVAFAAHALRLTRGWLSAWLVALTAATLVTLYAPASLWWLPWAIGGGCFLHCVGDSLTDEGVPWLWPLRPKPAIESPLWRKNGHFALPILGTTESTRETWAAGVLTAYVGLVLVETFLPGTFAAAGGWWADIGGLLWDGLTARR